MLSSGVAPVGGDAGCEMQDAGLGIAGCRLPIADWASTALIAGSAFAGDGDEKPIFKGVCAAGAICAGVAGDGFNFSGKFGSAEVPGAG